MGRELALHSLASGVVWGAGAAWLVVGRPASLLAWSFVVGGMVTAAAGTTAVHFASFASFALPALAALGVRLAMFPLDLVGPMPLLVGLFAVLMTAVARRTHASLGQSFRLRHENGELVSQLSAARAALWDANRELESQVEQRTAELAAERARLAQWIHDAPDGLLTLSGDQVLAFNPALARIVGRPAERLEGARFPELLTSDRDGARSLLARCASEGHATLETTLEVSGEARNLDVHATRATGQAGLVEIVIRDVTERRRAEQRRHESEDSAHRAARFEAIRRLAGGIAHEFNNILAVMQGTVESALQEGSPAAMRRGLEDLRAAVVRAAGVTRQLVSISQRPRGRSERFDLNGFVLAQRATIERMVGQEVHVHAVPAAGELPIVADAFRLEEALFHALVYLTAVQVADTRNDRIVLRSLRVEPGPLAVLELSYERPPPATLAAKSSTLASDVNGTLELSAMRELVTQQGGSFEAEVEPQHIRFRSSWPLVEAPSGPEPFGAARPAAASERAMSAGGERVLVVDDEPGLLSLVSVALESHGFVVLRARDAASALDLAAETPGAIHVLVTDVVMPGIDGPTLASRLRQLRPELRVCFMSGYTAAYLRDSLREWSGAALLEKPFTMAKLVETVSELAARH